MTAHLILRLNAICTALSAAGMLAARGFLHALFGLESPILLDGIAVGLLMYAAALAATARRQTVTRQALIAFTVADALWVVGSALVLVMFWNELAPIARFLVIAVALVVELFAALQYRAAEAVRRGALEAA